MLDIVADNNLLCCCSVRMAHSLYISLFILSIICLLVQSHNEDTDYRGDKLYERSDLNRFRSLLSDPTDEEFDVSDTEDVEKTHLNVWTVRVDPADDEVADQLAKRFSFKNLGRIGSLRGYYKFTREIEEDDDDEDEKRSTGDGSHSLGKKRVRRHHIEHARLLNDHPQVLWCRREKILERVKRAPFSSYFNDPQYQNEWYINNVGQTSGPAHFDSKIPPVWSMGYTGKGIVLSVLDDGIDYTHPDLKDNFDPYASTDLNGKDSDPFPNDSDPYNAHGTKCAGTIAAVANNGICGVGIAHKASVGGIRMLDGKATDQLEADALSFNLSHIDIFSCSWGPKDNGQTFGRPGKLGRMALAAGSLLGRNGLGSIFVWATGNGGLSGDDCNCDGYVNSIYTIAIGSVNEHGVSTYYGEKCSATMAVTFCSGQHKFGFQDSKANVITTFLHHKCTNHFVGTSSAAPLAAGIIALVLEANPNLGWRDMQHLIVHTAQITSPLDVGWKKNGAGFRYNHKFGFGVLDAHKLVMAALKWKNVGKQHICHFPVKIKKHDIPVSGMLKIQVATDACQSKCKGKGKDNENGPCKHSITKLEHVVVTVTLKYRRRGDLSVELYSPFGTKSVLLHRRGNDYSTSGLKGWSFMTVFNWGENPKGTWTLLFKDTSGTGHNLVKKHDMEQVYIEMLDSKLKKNALRRQMAQGGKQSDLHKRVVEEEHHAFDDGETWERDTRRLRERAEVEKDDQRRAHVREMDAGLHEREGADEFDPMTYRLAWEKIKSKYETSENEDEEEDSARESIFKRSIPEDNEPSSPLFKDSPLAGVVKSISMTFYGTND